MRLRAVVDAWDEFFFKPVSPLPVALFRILFGSLVVVMLLTESIPDWDFWYTPRGPFLMDQVRQFFYRCPVFCMFDIVPSGAEHVYMVLVLLSAICVTIGLFTRWNCVLLWLSLVSMHHRCPWNISGCDDFMRFMSFCLIFSAAGEMLSVDDWWRRKYEPERVRARCAPWGQRMIQIQLALSYWGASVAKIGGDQWIDGTAVYYASHLEDFFRLPVGHLVDSLAVCQFLSWSTLVIEVALWTLIWFKECRYWVLLAGLLLHLGIDYSMTLPIFEMEFVAAYLCFIEPDDLMKLWHWLKKPLSRSTRPAVSGLAPNAVPNSDGQAGQSA